MTTNQTTMPNMQYQQPQPQQRQLQIKVPDDVLKGSYANTMAVFHTKEEFVMDFMDLYPHQGAGIVVSRVITSPGHMKRIAAALADNVKKYEAQFGKIEESQAPEGIGFRTA